MNRIIFSCILAITVITNMLVFPVYAGETPVFDTQIAAESMLHEERPDDPGEAIVIGGDDDTAPENDAISEGVLSEDTEATEEEAGTPDANEKDSATDGNAGEAADRERNEGEAEQPEGAETGMSETIPGNPEIPSAGMHEATADDSEALSDGATEAISSDPENPSAGGTETISDDPEDPSAGGTEVIPGDPNDLAGEQTPADDAESGENLEDVEPAAPAMVYQRPVITKISTDGRSITLEWDNPEGELFRIYRWSIIPRLIGTSTTGSFVDTDVAYGWTYSYYIATNSSVYRYPYSQTVSKWVRRPIEDIDEAHRIGEDLAWDLGEREQGNGSLVISGSGSMPDFSSPSELPWRDRAGEIKHVSIDDGVTYVGDHSFSDMEGLEEVTLPSSVREYGHEVFRGSPNLEFFNHDSAVDEDQLHIAVQYLTGVYSGDAYEPEVYVRKGADGDEFDKMPALIRDKDYTVAYNNTTEVGDGTIEITFIGDYQGADSVVIPFTVISSLRQGEKIKNVTGIALLPSSSTYTGSAQRPDVVVRSGRWTLKEGVDYQLTYTDMVDTGTYTVTAEGIGAYSGEVQALYTIIDKEQSEDPNPPVTPSDPDDPKGPTEDPKPVKPSDPDGPKEPTEDPKPVKPSNPGDQKKPTEDPSSPVTPSSPSETWGDGADDVPSQETAGETTGLSEEAPVIDEGILVAEAKPENQSDPAPSAIGSLPSDHLLGEGDASLGDGLETKAGEPIIFFVGAVGIVASICIGVYFWFFRWFLHGM